LRKQAVLQNQAAFFDGTPYALHQPVRREGLGDEVVDAFLNGLDRHRNIAVAGHQDNR
jgi:hypothetical protein